ncbi:MAG: lipocalin family protein [Melioribacter sp.]|nr:lipocalin family protein [Melioribacter sp.]
MKKKIILTSFILLLVFTSCDKKDDNPVSPDEDIFGTWILTKVILPDYGNMELDPRAMGLSATFKMKSDHTFEMTFVDSDGTSTDTGTWSISDGKITMKSSSGDEVVFNYELSGNKMRITMQMNVSEFGLPGSGEMRVIMEFTKQ